MLFPTSVIVPEVSLTLISLTRNDIEKGRTGKERGGTEGEERKGSGE